MGPSGQSVVVPVVVPVEQQHKSTAISRVSGVEVQRLLYKLDRAASFLPVSIPRHAIGTIAGAASLSTARRQRGKHGSQIESIVAHMRHYGILPELSSFSKDDETDVNDQGCCFIEFGCGTAKLSDYLSQSESNEPNHAFRRNSNKASSTTNRNSAFQGRSSSQQQQQSPHQFILIDRQTFGRDKIRDGAIRARSRQVQRITQDIGTLNLASIFLTSSPPNPEAMAQPPHSASDGTRFRSWDDPTSMSPSPPPPFRLVAMSKHLCGVAVEYTMQCILDYCWEVEAKGHTTTLRSKSMDAAMMMPQLPQWQLYRQSLRRRPLIPMAIATCCHYSCREEFMRRPRHEDDETSMTTTDWFHQLGLTSRDWHVLVTISQWASLRLHDEATVDEVETTSDATASWYETVQEHSSELIAPFPPPVPLMPLPCVLDPAIEARFVSSDEFERNYDRREKQALGVRCKIVLDTARAHRLRDMGYAQVVLVAYTTESVEQHLLMAIP